MKKALMSGVAHIAMTAAGKNEWHKQHGEEQPPINKIGLNYAAKPSSLGGSTQNGLVNVAGTAKAR